MAIWLGISRVGATVALINTNLVGRALAHAINIAGPKHIIIGAGVAEQLVNVLPQLLPVKCWIHHSSDYDFPQIDREIERSSGDPLDHGEFRAPTLRDRALYIYTSGTTGLPKAANVSHFRVMQWCHWFAGLMDTGPKDRMYNCLPMYHSTGGVAASAAMLVNGGSVVLRQRFSASCFWNEIAAWNCTLFQYIGELCRYLVNSPPNTNETNHRIRLCCGNGLKLDIWETFKRRFRVPQILEFYAATEGNFSLYNCDEKPGAIGRIPIFLAHRFHVTLVKIDVDTSEPIRAADNRCVRCATNEVGEAIGKIRSDAPTSRFEGYADSDATQKKILRDVFVKGDAWFRTGDLMRKDEHGYFYFIDRLGDTFRWKGENVSTTEIAQAILAFPDILDVVVYGVSVPGTDGRAGMAALVLRPGANLNLPAFRQHLAIHLPTYARPLFLRILSEMEMTETFKPRKQGLAHDSYDPTATSDALYFDDHTSQAFVRIDSALYDRIRSQKQRL
jgi:fatty-acyl-CoA synthase